MPEHEKDPIHLTVEGKPISKEAATRVHEALKKTLQAELAKEGLTLGGAGGKAALDVSGHGRGFAAKTGQTEGPA